LSIGLCCQYLEVVNKKNKIEYKNIIQNKSLLLGQFKDNKYSDDRVLNTWCDNLDSLNSGLNKIHKEGYSVFRISSDLFPLFDFHSHLLSNSIFKSKLNVLSNTIKSCNFRVTSHPDQFVVLSSKNPNVIDNSFKILNQHAWLFDSLNLPLTTYYCINIHGGVKGEINKLIESINNLPENIKNRLTLENDERSYNVLELFDVYKNTGVSICFDSHHHSFNDAGLTNDKALDLARSTWKEKPLTHLSNTFPELMSSKSFADRRKHSDFTSYFPEYQKELNNSGQIDIDFEFKMKNLAIEKAVVDFGFSK
jgi:UV DNA damage endonuclease